jgi:hypothetical protein
MVPVSPDFATGDNLENLEMLEQSMKPCDGEGWMNGGGSHTAARLTACQIVHSQFLSGVAMPSSSWRPHDAKPDQDRQSSPKRV